VYEVTPKKKGKPTRKKTGEKTSDKTRVDGLYLAADDGNLLNFRVGCISFTGSFWGWRCLDFKVPLDAFGQLNDVASNSHLIFSGATAPSGPWPQSSPSHSDTPQSVGLLRTSDQPVAETST
jgi:hypothetical protein